MTESLDVGDVERRTTSSHGHYMVDVMRCSWAPWNLAAWPSLEHGRSEPTPFLPRVKRIAWHPFPYCVVRDFALSVGYRQGLARPLKRD